MSKVRKRVHPPFTQLIKQLPATVPFVPPEALERQTGQPIRLRLGANESDFGVSPLAQEAMRQALEKVSWYGDSENDALRTALAHIHGVRKEEIVIGSGIDDLLELAVRTFVEPGVPVVTSLGSYPTFQFHVTGFGGQLHFVPYREWKNDLEALVEKAREVDARLLYLANPDNPTGTWHSADDVARLIDALPPGCVLILDEAYIEFAPPSAHLPIQGDHPQVIRMRTFSKAYGMAGARIGYAIACEETISAFDKVRLHFGVNRIAQAGALASLQDPDFVRDVVNEVNAGKKEYEAMADELGWRAIPSATNFVAIDVYDAERARRIVDDLLNMGVFIRTPGVAPLNRLIRITVGKNKHRKQLSEALKIVADQVR